MSNRLSQFWNARDAVAEASSLVALLVGSLAADGKQRDAAIRSIAVASHTSASLLRRLSQPSRRPKSVGFDVMQRLRGTYLAHLRRQMVAIELEIRRIEAGPGARDAAVQGLLDEAEAIASELPRLLA